MTPVTHPFVALGVVSILAALGIAAVAWYQRESAGAREYAVMMVALAIWSMLYVMQLLQPTVADKTPWLIARHALIPFIGILFWVFAARYTDRPALLLKRYLLPAIAVGVAISAIAVWNPDGIYWVELSAAETNSIPVVDIAFGSGFWLNVGYTFGVVAGGYGYIVRMYQSSLDVYRPQLAAIITTGILIFGLTVVFLSDYTTLLPSLNPWPHIQLITYGATLMVIPIGWSYISGTLFRLQPMAGQTVIESMDDPVFVFDTNDVLQYTNSAALTLLESTESLNAGEQTVETVFGDQPVLRAQYRKTGSGQEPDSETVEFVVDGWMKLYDLQSSVIYTSSGQAVGKVVSARDVTEVQYRRSQLRERTEELEAKKAQLEEKKSQLEAKKSQLEAKKSQLEHQNKQLDRFNSFISHDLRSPLQVADGYVHLAKKTGDLSHLSNVEDSLERMEGMIEDLRELTRINQTNLSTEPVDIGTAADQAWMQVETETAQLEVDASGELMAERELLLHVFENLYRNAVEHGAPDMQSGTDEESDHDEPPITVRVCQIDGGFAIEDDGEGIPEDERDSVLEHGYSTANDGTGLGMSIVRTIAEAHGWEITVTESHDGGARFEFHGVDMASTNTPEK